MFSLGKSSSHPPPTPNPGAPGPWESWPRSAVAGRPALPGTGLEDATTTLSPQPCRPSALLGRKPCISTFLPAPGGCGAAGGCPSRFRLDPAAAAGGKASAPQERRFGILNPKILPSSAPVTGQKITPSPHGSHIHSAITQGRGQGPLKTDLLLGAEVRTPAGCMASRPRGEHFRGGHSGGRATGRPTAQRTTTGDPRLPAASVRKNCFVFSKETLSISSPRETGKTELKYQRHRNSLRLAGSEWPGAVASRWL